MHWEGQASGKATLYSYVIHHRPVPGFTPPYAIAVVELAEGPRMVTNIVDCDPERLRIGDLLKVFPQQRETKAQKLRAPRLRQARA